MDKITFINGQAPFLNEQNLNQLQTNVENAIEAVKNEVNENIPTKLSELENDDNYIKSTESAYFTNGVRMCNSNTQSDGRKVDLLVEHIQGVGYGGYEDDLHLNHRSSNDVRILEEGTGTLYYKGKEVADREYVDEKIADIEVDIEDIDLTDYATKKYVDEKIENIEISGGGSIVEGSTVDTLPIGSVVMFNGNEIPDGYIELEDYEPTYSLEEKRIGTWIDGKPIYRKVIIGTTIATLDTWNKIADVEFDEIVSMQCVVTSVNENYPSNEANIPIIALKNTKQVCEKHFHEFWSGKQYKVILEYTKTTDEGVQ